MTDKQIKVGDVVNRGRDVPPGALVKSSGGRFIWRRGDEGQIVKVPGDEPWGVDDVWWWQWYATSDMVTIIAIDVPAGATAEHLRTLAEVYEVREAWRELTSTHDDEEDGDDALQAAAEHLHAAGWRPGMTAKDAARLLAGAG